MKVIKISKNEYNYRKDDGTYLLDDNVYRCYDFKEGFGLVKYKDYNYNFVNSDAKQLLKTNVIYSGVFYTGVSSISIDNYFKTKCLFNILNSWYFIDKECNFYNEDKVSFKELYNLYPNIRSELIEIIDKYTYFNVEEYFI